jgi:hypothetical protein
MEARSIDRGTSYFRASSVMAISNSAAPSFPFNQVRLYKIQQVHQGHHNLNTTAHSPT